MNKSNETNRSMKLWYWCIAVLLLQSVHLMAQRPVSSFPSPNTIQSSPSNDTSRVRVIYSEKLIGTLVNNERIKTLVGNVQLQQEDVKLRCDSAVVIGNDVEAHGNVVIIQSDTVKIFADSAYYWGNIKKSTLVGEVVLTDGKATLFTDKLDYDMSTKIATYKTGAILENENTRLTSQRGYYYTKQNIAHFGGNVVVADPEFSLKADTLMVDTDKNISYFLGPTDILTKDKEQIYTENGFYDPNNEYAEFTERPRFKGEDGFAKSNKMRYIGKQDEIHLEGDAYFKNDNQEAEADTIIYNTALKQFSSKGVTTIQEEGRSIIADRSFYDDSLDVAVFVGNVCISDSNQIICADSIRYNEANKEGQAFGNVVSRDTVEKVTLECERLDYNDSTSFVVATGRPLMTSLINGDSLSLSADTLISYSTDTLNFADSMRLVIAFRQVRVFKSDFQAVCDSLVYSTNDSLFQFFIDPVLWSDTSQFTGVLISALLKNEKINQIRLDEKAFLINSTDEIYFNQIKGREIVAHFKNDSIRTMNVDGSGETVYYILDDNDAYVTANKTVCGKMKVIFQNNELKDILFYGQPSGQTHPIEKITPKTLQMEGFSWRIQERPKSKDDLRLLPNAPTVLVKKEKESISNKK